MANYLPSLTALRAFEVAARHLSFTRAAEELHVTQAAVSHQIKHLEEQLGVALFRRMNRSLMLSDAGQALLPSATEAFQILAAGVERVSGLGHENRLVVSTIESIAAEWLVPRLGRFRLRYPEIEVVLSISDALVDFQRDEIDVGIRYGSGGWPKVAAEKLTEESIFPVLAPHLLEDGPALNEPADLRNFTLIHEYGVELWSDWFAAAGVADAGNIKGPVLPHSNLVLAAVIAGDGVALGRSFLISGDLKNGRLVRPFAVSVTARDAYYLVWPPGTEERLKVRRFRNWLREEVALTRQALSEQALA